MVDDPNATRPAAEIARSLAGNSGRRPGRSCGTAREFRLRTTPCRRCARRFASSAFRTTQNSPLLVTLAGAIDLAVTDQLDNAAAAIEVGSDRATVDVGAVTFFGGPGLNFLSRLAATEPVCLANVPAQSLLPRLLQAVALDRAIGF